MSSEGDTYAKFMSSLRNDVRRNAIKANGTQGQPHESEYKKHDCQESFAREPLGIEPLFSSGHFKRHLVRVDPVDSVSNGAYKGQRITFRSNDDIKSIVGDEGVRHIDGRQNGVFQPVIRS